MTRLLILYCDNPQLPESHERHRPCYIDFASALLHELESGVRVLTREEAHSIAESCGFHGTAEASIALRIMEKVRMEPPFRLRILLWGSYALLFCFCFPFSLMLLLFSDDDD